MLSYRRVTARRTMLFEILSTAAQLYEKFHLKMFPIGSVGDSGGSRSTVWRGPYGERGARSYNGVWGLCTLRGPGAEPLVRESGGEAPLKLNAFWCCHMSEMALNCYVYELFYGH